MAPRENPGELRAGILGSVLEAGDAEFIAACHGFNLAFCHRPDLVVMPKTAQDIAVAVRYARRLGQRIQVHSTGHGFGDTAEGGMLINTSKMDSVLVDPERQIAIVGAGAQWHQVIAAAAEHSLAPLNGSSVTVGVVGYILGGGMGPMARTFGFAADHVRRIQMVTANGSLIEVTQELNPELFWGLRGGKCSVGIVTEIEFDLMEVDHVYGGGIFFAGADAPAVLHTYGQWVTTLPNSTTASVALLRLPDLEMFPPDLRGKLTVHLRYVHVGSDQDGVELLAPMRHAAVALLDLVDRMPYSAIGSVHQDPQEPMPAWDGSVLLRELPTAAIMTLLEKAGPQAHVPLIIVEVRAMGGALAHQAKPANAVGGRDAAFAVTVIGPYPPPLQAAVKAAGTGILSALEPWSTGHTQINFQGHATGTKDVARAWPQDTLVRLRALKQTWDPTGQFHFSYCVV